MSLLEDLHELMRAINGGPGTSRKPMRLGDGSELSRLERALADWELVKDEPVVVGRLAVIKAARKPKRMLSVGKFPITPVEPDDDRLAAEAKRKRQEKSDG